VRITSEAARHTSPSQTTSRNLGSPAKQWFTSLPRGLSYHWHQPD